MLSTLRRPEKPADIYKRIFHKTRWLREQNPKISVDDAHRLAVHLVENEALYPMLPGMEKTVK